MEVFAERLKFVREQKGWTQRELARRCDLGPNQISRYENNLIEPSIGALYTLAQHLNVSTDYLLGLVSDSRDIPEPGDVPAEEDELMQIFRKQGYLGVIKFSAERLTE